MKIQNTIPSKQGFPFISTPDSKILVLGSFPSEMSLKESQYYAHSRNCFWKIIASFFSVDLEKEKIEYSQKVNWLQELKIALWDVFAFCYREGSLDSKIDWKIAEMNDFNLLFSQCKNIKSVFFNGKSTFQLYLRKTKQLSIQPFLELNPVALPSTSPANAQYTFQEKKSIWYQAIHSKICK